MKQDKQQGPAMFLRWLAALPFRRDLCIECGAGQAEPSAFLKPLFGQVIAMDAAPPSRWQQYYPVKKCPAESLPISSNSVDLLFSMQAAHFFDLQKHTQEAQKVLRPGGIFGVFAWGEIELNKTVERAYLPILEILTPFWEANRDWVVNGYEGITFPGERIQIPAFHLTKWLTPKGLEAEMAAWSATQAAFKSGIELPEPELAKVGLGEKNVFACHWKIVGQVFRY